MKGVDNIIAVKKVNEIPYREFEGLMHKTEIILNQSALKCPAIYKNMSPNDLEKCAVDNIRNACSGTSFNPENVNLISGHRFPDIVAEQYYGIEVKSTKEDHWTSTGSSIVETTRIKDVRDIYMLFGKLGGKVPEFKCRPYQDVLYDIAVTHSPRYLINMDIDENGTIFKKMGTTYDDFRTSQDSISQVRRYYRNLAKKQKRQEMPWWITSDNIETAHSFTVRLWNSLEPTEKRELQILCMILFPEVLNPVRSRTKYNNATLWLCSYSQVVNPNIRDLFSAGGQITHVDNELLKEPIAQVFSVIVEYANDIKKVLTNPNPELEMMIKDYNPNLLLGNDLYEEWLKICCKFAGKNGNLLKNWINQKPRFSFSKN